MLGEIDLAISDKNDRLTVIIPKTLKEELKQLAANENRSMGNYIVTVLEDHVNSVKRMPRDDNNRTSGEPYRIDINLPDNK